MDINFELYKVFYHAATELNYTKAAEHLYVSQSSVSQSIQSLEKQLGVKLFFRSGRYMQLTEEGKVLLSHVEQAFFLFKNGEKSLDAIHALERGTLRIGASDTISKFYLLPYIKRFTQQYPGVQLQIVNRPSPVSVDLVEKHQLDLGIININPKKTYASLNVTGLKKGANIFIASPDRIKTMESPGSLKEIIRQPLITLEANSTTRSILDRFLESENIHWEPSFEFGSVDLIIEMTKLNMGIGFVSAMAASQSISQGEIIELHFPAMIPMTEIGLITSSTAPLSPAAKVFVDMLMGGSS